MNNLLFDFICTARYTNISLRRPYLINIREVAELHAAISNIEGMNNIGREVS